MQRLSRVAAWDSRFEYGTASWLRFSKCTFCPRHLFFELCQSVEVKTVRFYLPQQCPFGPIAMPIPFPQSTWRRRKNPDFLWAGNRWRRGHRDLGSALTMLTSLEQKSFCQKTIHGPRRLSSQIQMRAQLQIQIQMRRSCVLIWQHCPHTLKCVQPGERATIVLPECFRIRRISNATTTQATLDSRTSSNNNSAKKNWDIHKILPVRATCNRCES